MFHVDFISFRWIRCLAAHNNWLYRGNNPSWTHSGPSRSKLKWSSFGFCSVFQRPEKLLPSIIICEIFISKNLWNNHPYMFELIIRYVLPCVCITNNTICLYFKYIGKLIPKIKTYRNPQNFPELICSDVSYGAFTHIY